MMFDAFISDTHFFHKKIIEYCHRPFSSVEEMNEELIQRYNDRIGKNEHVLWLGDCFFASNRKAKQILDRMNGKKSLILGNHDASEASMLSRGFELVAHKIRMNLHGREAIFIHYDNWDVRSPFDDRYYDRRHPLTFDKMEIIVHGHTHQPTKRLLHQIHVGVDAWDYGPARYEELKPLVEEIPFHWTDSFRNKLEKLKEYRSHLFHRKNKDLPEETITKELAKPKFDEFRVLGWELETRDRMK